MNWEDLKTFAYECETGEATEEQGIEAVHYLMTQDVSELHGKDLAIASDVLQGLAQILSDRLFG